jgi:hypothetical protein
VLSMKAAKRCALENMSFSILLKFETRLDQEPLR